MSLCIHEWKTKHYFSGIPCTLCRLLEMFNCSEFSFLSLSVVVVFFTRAAMTSIQQLRGDLTSSGDQPSTNLATYFKVGL